MQNIRNIAIIAHVDHGKTTLVDALLKQSNMFRQNELLEECVMDSNELERERGITIFSKNAAIRYSGVKFNIVDTPGHADFGGEVERIMNLVDGALLVVDAKEGPMPQTKFVLKKAIAAGHKIIVVINKIDKKDARPEWALDKTFDLFVELGASDSILDFPVIYAAAALGLAGNEPNLAAMKDIQPLYETIISSIPAPKGDPEAPLQISVVNLSYDNFKGKIAVGRVVSGRVKNGEEVMRIDRDGKSHPAKISKLMIFEGLGKCEIETVSTGEIVAIAGISDIAIGETIASFENPKPLPVLAVEEPTVKMNFSVNTSPFAGREGEFFTSRHLKERLEREVNSDVALRFELGDSADSFVVSGRGELHLSILIEKMRREGYEFQVSRPQVILKEENGKTLEPYETVSIEAPENFAGSVIEKLGSRRAELKDMRVAGGVTFLEFDIPTRGLIGYRSDFLTDTKGLGIMNSLLLGYRPHAGEIFVNPHGSLVAFEAGVSNTYGLLNAQGRGTLFIGPGVPVYAGQIVGQNSKDEDLEVNVCKEKKLSNMRSKGDGESERLDVPRVLSLEESLEYIGDDELLEVTPKSLRLRKRILGSIARKRAKTGG